MEDALSSWLGDANQSVEDAKNFIRLYPAALMGFYDDDIFALPLHLAIRCRASDEVILLLLEACPQAAKELSDGRLPFRLPFHLATDRIHNQRFQRQRESQRGQAPALLNAHPGAASERDPCTGNLPLHDAFKNKEISEEIILSLLNAYPQAAAEKMEYGWLLFEKYLERKRKASDDMMREICKVRVDGLLPLGIVLTKRSSDDDVLAVLEAYPEAAGKRFSTKFDERILPMHIAYEDEHSEPVKDALRRAYPDAEKENPFETTYQLHKLLENEPLNYWAGDGVENLIKMYPEAVGKRGRDGRPPLHIAIDRIAARNVTEMLFDEYPQAGKEKMKDGRLPIEVFAGQKETDGWSQFSLTEMVTGLLKNDMPVSIEDGTPVEHSGSWHACISCSTKTATCAVRRVLLDSNKMDDDSCYGGGFGKRIHALAEVRDAKGRTALGLASEGPREVIYEYLLFCGRYKLQIGPPEHRTATSVVLRAQDLAEQADYGVIFDKADKDGNGKLDRKELKAIASSIGLDPGMFLKRSDAEQSDESISKGEFLSICKRQLGAGPREVVIKLMKNKDQWERECNARKKYELDSKYVVSALPNIPSEDAIANAVRNGEGGLDTIVTKYLNGIEVGEHAFVMEAGDRNLLQMFYQEQPNIDAVRHILRQVFEAVEHLHKEKLMHGDIKMLNIVRFRIDNGLRLIDLDASAKIVPPGGEEDSFAGAKFSSAILPPEMIERIKPGDVEAFKKYWKWKVQNDNDLDKKVAPKIYKDQGIGKAQYVVKSFRTGLDGKPIYDGLPYKLVRASESIDRWSLGVLAFNLLTGESLIPSTRDEDCVSGNAMHFLYSWGTRPEVLDEVFSKIQDEAARDLVWKLLQKEPGKRPSITTLLKKHHFFNQQSVDLLEKLTGINTSLEDSAKNRKDDRALLERMDANIEVIKDLGTESKAELVRTRYVLLKGIFEATEVCTPTTFIVLNDKLPEPPNEKLKKKILDIVAAEDGSGVSMKTKYASLAVSAEGFDIDLEGDLKEYHDQVKAGIKWANRIENIGTKVAAGEVGKAFDTIKEGISDLIVGGEMYLYLVDELTGEPVRAKGWPLIITTPSDLVPKLLPLMQVGIRAMCIYHGIVGLAAMFGFPLPRVPKDWSKGAQESVELLKKESSVEEFGVVHEEVEGGTEEKKSVRGASLRAFVDFLKKNDPGLSDGNSGDFAGLQRIGDPEDGTALWTALTDQADIENALKKRTKQREEEQLKHNEHIKKMAGEKIKKLEEGASTATATAASNAAVSSDQACSCAIM